MGKEKTEQVEATAEASTKVESGTFASSGKKSGECPNTNNPTLEHKMFHNEGTGENYCVYCGKPE